METGQRGMCLGATDLIICCSIVLLLEQQAWSGRCVSTFGTSSRSNSSRYDLKLQNVCNSSPQSCNSIAPYQTSSKTAVDGPCDTMAVFRS